MNYEIDCIKGTVIRMMDISTGTKYIYLDINKLDKTVIFANCCYHISEISHAVIKQQLDF